MRLRSCTRARRSRRFLHQLSVWFGLAPRKAMLDFLLQPAERISRLHVGVGSVQVVVFMVLPIRSSAWRRVGARRRSRSRRFSLSARVVCQSLSFSRGCWSRVGVHHDANSLPYCDEQSIARGKIKHRNRRELTRSGVCAIPDAVRLGH